MDVLEQIRTAIADSLGCDVSAVTVDSDIKEDLGADSLAVMELIMALEDAFNITIDEDEASSAATVADIVKIVSEKTT